MQNISIGDNLHENGNNMHETSNHAFLGKIRKKYFNMWSASTLNVKGMLNLLNIQTQVDQTRMHCIIVVDCACQHLAK